MSNISRTGLAPVGRFNGVNGRYDFTFSLEKAQNPLFAMLGTPAADKQHVVLDTPRDVRARRPELVAAVLGWLDKYLGRVE